MLGHPRSRRRPGLVAAWRDASPHQQQHLQKPDLGPKESATMQTSGSVAEQRRNALRALLLVTLPITTLLLVSNLRLGAGVLALANLVLLLVSLGELAALHRGVSSETLALAYLVALFSNIATTLTAPNIQPGTITSLALIPVLSYLLLDARRALPLTLGALAASLGAFFVGAQAMPYRLTPRLVGHVTVPVLVLFVLCHVYARGRTRSVNRMLDRVLRDPLTGLWNREKLTRTFVLERQRSKDDRTPLALILIDLDHFKTLNDRYGHDAGDEALAFVARLMLRRLRGADLACRIGGEEFAVLLRATNAAGALKVAEDLRQALEGSVFWYRGERIEMTLSAGIAELGRDGIDWLTLYRVADERLYACKAQGRNRVIGSSDQAA